MLEILNQIFPIYIYILNCDFNKNICLKLSTKVLQDGSLIIITLRSFKRYCSIKDKHKWLELKAKGNLLWSKIYTISLYSLIWISYAFGNPNVYNTRQPYVDPRILLCTFFKEISNIIYVTFKYNVRNLQTYYNVQIEEFKYTLIYNFQRKYNKLI